MEIIIQFKIGDLIISKSFQETEKDKLGGFIDFNVNEIGRLKEKFGRWPTREEWEANMIRHA